MSNMLSSALRRMESQGEFPQVRAVATRKAVPQSEAKPLLEETVGKKIIEFEPEPVANISAEPIEVSLPMVLAFTYTASESPREIEQQIATEAPNLHAALDSIATDTASDFDILPMPLAVIPLPTESSAEYRRLAGRIRDLEPTARVLAFLKAGQVSDDDFSLARVALALAEMDLGAVTLIEATASIEGSWRVGRSPGGPGLAEALRGEADWNAAAKRTSHANIFVVGPGDGAATPDDAQLELSAWRELRETWRFALLDAGAADQSGGWRLAARADAAYLVVRLGQTRAADLARLVADYRAAGVDLRGCVAIGG